MLKLIMSYQVIIGLVILTLIGCLAKIAYVIITNPVAVHNWATQLIGG